MKKVVCMLGVVLAVVAVGVCLLPATSQDVAGQVLRVHVRANSNDENDQAMKYLAKDCIVSYLTPLLEFVQDREVALAIVEQNQEALKSIVDASLAQSGFAYQASISLCVEYFPTRVYDGITFEEGYYQAIVVALGEGVGENWWCVMYPPLCFSATATDASGKIIYRSWIAEWLASFS